METKIINVFDLEDLFLKKIPKIISDYYNSGSRDEVTLRRNREIFNNFELMPKLLRDVSDVNTKTEILGLKLDHPIILGPVAMHMKMVK